MNRYQKRAERYLLAGAALAAFGPLSPALAQELVNAATTTPVDNTATANRPVEEITVTARRRSERLQDVPIAVTVLTSEEIARAGIQDVRDYANLTPNVTYGQGLNLGRNFLTIRGIGQSVYGPPPAAIVVDPVLDRKSVV